MSNSTTRNDPNVPDPPPTLRVGTAGWSIPRECNGQFPPDDSVLQRYARRFGCVEINSSFYRPHRRATYERWAGSTPDEFRFSVKLPKDITHTLKLWDAGAPLARFLEEVSGLDKKIGPILVQLPPSLAFDNDVQNRFFGLFRDLFDGEVVCEPRHATWVTQSATELLVRHAIGRVLADPSPCQFAKPFDPSLPSPYYRLHGNPHIYYSNYPAPILTQLARNPAIRTGSWCIFDNTAAGAATCNALQLDALLRENH